ncbi:hypothetical protein [Streptomyces sp. NPDC060366]|uniref:hypothetical protein n=1 Tax=Streptomyces sp. NPDC060366 TaxID=3347105 RepID=UPI00365FDF19
MPAADQVHDSEPVPGLEIGTVIHLADRTTGRRTGTIPEPQPAPVPDALSDDPLQRIGEQVQALFTAHGRTLTDGKTADAMRITLDGVLGLINGALAQGAIEPEQHSMLTAMIQGMRDAPERL